jgi:hypothetical protein
MWESWDFALFLLPSLLLAQVGTLLLPPRPTLLVLFELRFACHFYLQSFTPGKRKASHLVLRSSGKRNPAQSPETRKPSVALGIGPKQREGLCMIPPRLHLQGGQAICGSDQID